MIMMMRLLSELIFVMCLLIMANSIGSSDAARRLNLASTEFMFDDGNKRSLNYTPNNNVQALTQSHCRASKAKGSLLHFCHYFSNYFTTKNKNTSIATSTTITSNTSSSSISEDKRVVPTGSNPLHNK
ncbi:hypothetical protein CsatA_013024 [Cannabis sativa]